MSMLTVVAIASLSLAVISFLIFGYQVYLRRTQVTHQMSVAQDSLDLAKLVEAFAKLERSFGTNDLIVQQSLAAANDVCGLRGS
jgi:hypothetical protein